MSSLKIVLQVALEMMSPSTENEIVPNVLRGEHLQRKARVPLTLSQPSLVQILQVLLSLW